MSGRIIGNYRIVDYIGSGAFGSVYKAEDVNTAGRIVAIKELHKKHTRNTVIKQRFFQEAVAMARLDHPNLPRLFTFGEDNGCYYLVMEFIDGRLLRDDIEAAGAIKAAVAVSIIQQVVEAVNYAHANGIIHRDLKPDNIMLTSGETPRVKVLDFGIARMVGGENLTMTGEGFGTPAYMSPERITGAPGVDHRTDIYSLGIILVEMLTGKAPFESRATDPAQYWFEMRKLHESQDLPPLSSLGVAAELESIIRKAAAKRVEDRYQTATEMLTQIRNLAGDDIQIDASANTSKLILTTAPGAAEVFVDEIPRGVSDEVRGKILVDNLTPGVHSVRVSKAGYNDYRISVSLEEGRQTDLQVALPARATVAIPQFENDTAVVDFSTQRIESDDNVQTALLAIESLPVGSTVFVGTRAVALADANGRATVALQPGVHDVQVAAPTGGLGKRRITVTNEDTGSLKTITLPVTQPVATTKIEVIKREPLGPGRRIAVAAVSVLLIALAVTTYFVLRGPSRQSTLAEEASVAQQSQPATDGAVPTIESGVAQPTAQTTDETKQKEAAVDAKSKDASNPTKSGDSAKAAGESSSVGAAAHPAVVPHPTTPEPPSPPQQQPAADNQSTCIAVSVTSADGLPLRGVRVALALASSSGFHGQTNAKGRWRHCDLAAGQQGKVVVFGLGGGILASRPIALASGENFVTIQIERSPKVERPSRGETETDKGPGFRPKRRPFLRRPQ